MKEYIVDWDPMKVDLLNEKVPELLKDTFFDIHFELYPTKIEVSTPTGSYEIDGHPQVKITIDNTSKAYFTWVLKHGENIDENFPLYLGNYISTELGFNVQTAAMPVNI